MSVSNSPHLQMEDHSISQDTALLSGNQPSTPNLRFSNEMIINTRVGGYRRERERESDDSISSDLAQRLPRRRRLNDNSQFMIEDEIQPQLSLSLQRVEEVLWNRIQMTQRQWNLITGHPKFHAPSGRC